MITKCLIIPAVTLLSVIFFGCAATAKEAKNVLTSNHEPPKYVAHFDYTPDTQAAPGSAGVTFAVTDATFLTGAKDTKPWFMYPQFENLHKAIPEDVTKLLVAKGFSVRGPFDSYDLIPYPDKKAIDLWLVPTVELSFKTPEETYSIEDIKIEVTVTMKLKMQEINTRELMWAKSIPFKFEFPCKKPGQNRLNAESIQWGEGVVGSKDVYDRKIKKQIVSLELGPNSMNEIAKGIEKEYPAIMANVSKLIDAEEMQIIKKQCQELKSKK